LIVIGVADAPDSEIIRKTYIPAWRSGSELLESCDSKGEELTPPMPGNPAFSEKYVCPCGDS
jgi:hypothetical protein